MTALVLRQSAEADIEAAVEYYRTAAGADVARRFVDELQQAMQFIADHPAGGSLRYAFELGVPGLRSMGLNRFPSVIFWLPREDEVDLWRVLHGHRDIPSTLR